ncbi:MAG: metal ABC transporter substrate-binding protein [Treponema sp.]|nr:metal ABC transporter substrate-binding protein [Treponema sp.]
MKKLSILLIAGLLISGSLISCKAKKPDNSGKINVLCTIFPEYDWARSILGQTDNYTNLTLLVKSGVDLHNYQPSTADIVAISSCDLFVYVGGESDAWVKDALKNATNPNMKVINLMEVLGETIKEEEVVEGMQEAEEGHHHHHHDEEEADHHHEEEESEDMQEEVEYDEHVWLSVKNAKKACQVFTDAICQLVPQNAETYKSNLEDYIAQLDNLDLTYAGVIAAAPNKTIIVCDRFPLRYLVEDYNLKYYAAFVGCSAETEASFETVAFLANKLKELQLPAVLVMDGSDQKIAKTVILNAKLPKTDILTIDSMQSTSLRQAFDGKNYINVMQENLESLKKALN